MFTRKKIWKQSLLLLLTLVMLFSSATAAFADGNGKGRGNAKNEKKQHETKIEIKDDKIKIKMSFKDLEKYAWAEKFIAQLAADRVFEGYDDGTFRPQQSVKRVEAIIAAVRLMGLRDAAEAKTNTELNFKDADHLKKKFPNAVGYVAVALENDLFTETEEKVQPEKAADRLWATMLLVKAMKLEDEAKAKMNAKLPFRDAKEIPAPSIGYVAVALEKGLISGYTDGSFKPNRPVTRAELAALLGRMDEQQPEETDTNGIKGTITQAVYNSVLTLSNSDKVTAYVVDPGAFIFRNGAKVTASDLKVGDQVSAKAYNNVVIFIEVTKPVANPTEPQVNFIEEGKYQYHTMNKDGKIATIAIAQTVNGQMQVKLYTVSENVTVIGSNQILVLNRDIVLKGTNQVVNTIEIK